MKLVRYMKKKEIIELLKRIPVPCEQFVVTDNSSIVYHGLKRECDYVKVDSLVDFSFDNVKVSVVSSLNSYDKIDGYFFSTIKLTEFFSFNSIVCSSLFNINVFSLYILIIK